jgi:hypothetical protein
VAASGPNIDSIFFSVLLGLVFIGFFGYVARKMKIGAPSKTTVRRSDGRFRRHPGA